MKKLFKRMAAALLVTMLVLSTAGISAFAAGTVKVGSGSKADISDHEFKAYRIFEGSQASGSKILTDIEWGQGIDKNKTADFLLALKAADSTNFGSLTSGTSAEDLAVIISAFTNDSAPAKTVANTLLDYLGTPEADTLTNGSSVTLQPGYYLIVDDTDVQGKSGTAQNAALLQITGGDIEIAVKTDIPEVEKKVKENTKYSGTHAGILKPSGTTNYISDGYNDSADYNIGDTVPYELYSVVPDMSRFINDYKYVFHDTMTAGLTFKPETVVVKIGDAEPLEEGTGKDYQLVYPGEDGDTFDIIIPKLNRIEGVEKGQLITVSFDAELNDKALIGQQSSGTPAKGNENKVYLEFSNQPNGSGTGITEEDNVIVFTYELDVNKESESGTKLEKAQFILYRKSGTQPVYVQFNSGTKRVTGWTTSSGSASPLISDANGFFNVIGLDDDTYYLKETVAPEGYNLLKKDIEVKVIANTSNGQTNTPAKVQDLTSLMVEVKDQNDDVTKASGTLADGIVEATVVNTQGSVLPTTGGIGTTIFYTLGAILVIGGGVLLVTRKRMHA